MCAGLIIKHEIKIYFPNPKAILEGYDKNGEYFAGVWGRRNENELKSSNLPITGWARKESINKGYWNKYSPKRLYIHAKSFMEKDSEKNSHWFDLKNNESLAGIMCKWDSINVIYIVTDIPPSDMKHIHDRWPLILKIED